MNLFKYRAGELYAEDVPVRKLADKYGTPLYVYSYSTLLRHFHAYDRAFDGYPHIICFAVKANPNTAILRLFAKNGGGADIVSGGELFAALKAGISPKAWRCEPPWWTKDGASCEYSLTRLSLPSSSVRRNMRRSSSCGAPTTM